MAKSFFESEKFRAQIHLLSGSTLCSPFCLNTLDLIRDHKFCGLLNMAIAFVFFVAGCLIISNSYSIMYEQDLRKNA